MEVILHRTRTISLSVLPFQYTSLEVTLPLPLSHVAVGLKRVVSLLRAFEISRERDHILASSYYLAQRHLDSTPV